MVYTTHYNDDLGDGFLLGFPVSPFPTLFLFLFLFHSVTGEGCNIQGPLGNGSDLFIFFSAVAQRPQFSHATLRQPRAQSWRTCGHPIFESRRLMTLIATWQVQVLIQAAMQSLFSNMPCSALDSESLWQSTGAFLNASQGQTVKL